MGTIFLMCEKLLCWLICLIEKSILGIIDSLPVDRWIFDLTFYIFGSWRYMQINLLILIPTGLIDLIDVANSFLLCYWYLPFYHHLVSVRFFSPLCPHNIVSFASDCPWVINFHSNPTKYFVSLEYNVGFSKCLEFLVKFWNLAIYWNSFRETD